MPEFAQWNLERIHIFMTPMPVKYMHSLGYIGELSEVGPSCITLISFKITWNIDSLGQPRLSTALLFADSHFMGPVPVLNSIWISLQLFKQSSSSWTKVIETCCSG